MTGFLDARTDDVGESLDASVCIVGAGAAGITLARELSKTMPGVLLIESGDLRIDGQTQGLTVGRQLGLPYHNLVSCRLRYFGGTTNHWSGYCRANDPIDYEGRPELGLPAWPVGAEELAPWIAQAGESLNVDAEGFDLSGALEDRGLDPEDLVDARSDILVSKTFQLSTRRRLGRVNRADFSEAENLRTVLNLNLAHIQLSSDGGSVSHLDCKTLTGKSVRVTAKAFALCCHGIENARQLLIANDVRRGGIGNAGDHVGRYFMDHTFIFASRWIPSRAFPRLYDRKVLEDENLNVNISFTDAHTRDKSLLQYYCRFNPVYVSERTKEALIDTWEGAFQPGDLDYLADVGRIATEAAGTVRQALSLSGLMHPRPDYYAMEHRLEQAPNPASRVVISDRKDALDTPVADLDWRMNEHDVASFREGQAEVARELAALGWGRMQEEEITSDLVDARVEGHYHQIGTTRMSETESTGVVDANCRVHGVANLYVGGSSIFPTAGYSGPTMMLIAFAMRLASHLKEQSG